MVYALKAGYGRKGAKIGSRDGEAELFRDDMVAFWRRTLRRHAAVIPREAAFRRAV